MCAQRVDASASSPHVLVCTVLMCGAAEVSYKTVTSPCLCRCCQSCSTGPRQQLLEPPAQPVTQQMTTAQDGEVCELGETVMSTARDVAIDARVAECAAMVWADITHDGELHGNSVRKQLTKRRAMQACCCSSRRCRPAHGCCIPSPLLCHVIQEATHLEGALLRHATGGGAPVLSSSPMGA